MVILLWLFVGVLAATFVIYTAFLALCGYKLIEKSGVEIPAGITRVAKVWLAIGVPADVLYNWFVGTARFRELRRWTYSAHIQDRIDRGLWDHDTATWARFLNAGDAGHIKRLPPDSDSQ